MSPPDAYYSGAAPEFIQKSKDMLRDYHMLGVQGPSPHDLRGGKAPLPGRTGVASGAWAALRGSEP